jgi:hypothetical protein
MYSISRQFLNVNKGFAVDKEELEIAIVSVLEAGPKTGLTVDQIRRELKVPKSTPLSWVVDNISNLCARGIVFLKGEKEDEEDDREPVVCLPD